MSFSIARRRLLLTGAAAGAASRVRAQGRDGDVVEISKHETATIDGRQWDTPLPGGMTVDAATARCCCAFLPPRASPTCCSAAACCARRARAHLCRLRARARVEYRPWAHEVDISHAPKPDQTGEPMARNFLVSGLA